MKSTRIHERLMEGPGRANADKVLPMNRPNFKGTTDWETGKTTPLKRSSPLWKKGAMDKHNKDADAVLAKRELRADKAKVVKHAQGTVDAAEREGLQATHSGRTHRSRSRRRR